MTDVLAGRTALVTGAGRGIGRAVALGLADAGADLILLARSADQLEATHTALAERGLARGRIVLITADLAHEQQRTRAIETALARGRIDVLVNNAATVEPLGATAEIPVAELRWAFEVNVIAPIARVLEPSRTVAKGTRRYLGNRLVEEVPADQHPGDHCGQQGTTPFVFGMAIGGKVPGRERDGGE